MAALETGRTVWTAVLDAVRLEAGADVAAVTPLFPRLSFALDGTGPAGAEHRVRALRAASEEPAPLPAPGSRAA